MEKSQKKKVATRLLLALDKRLALGDAALELWEDFLGELLLLVRAERAEAVHLLHAGRLVGREKKPVSVCAENKKTQRNERRKRRKNGAATYTQLDGHGKVLARRHVVLAERDGNRLLALEAAKDLAKEKKKKQKKNPGRSAI
jgi:hypothetical protein